MEFDDNLLKSGVTLSEVYRAHTKYNKKYIQPALDIPRSKSNSAEHDILNAHKYKTTKKFCFFLAQISLECYFSCS